MIKECSKCKEEKITSEFYTCKTNKDGFDTRCKECSRKRAMKYYDKDKAKQKYLELKKENPVKETSKPCIERILEKVEAITETGCWIFTGSINKQGYGSIGNDAWLGKKIVSVHRKTYEHFNGDIPEGMFVCHKCDVPSCCNPNHLFIGTAKENSQDAVKKNRVAKGHRNSRAKLTNEQVELIRKTKEQKGNLKQLSQSLPVSYWQVIAIGNGNRR